MGSAHSARARFRVNLRARLLPRITQTLYADRLPLRAPVRSAAAPYLESGLSGSFRVQFGV
jgi:hypothetical protein